MFDPIAMAYASTARGEWLAPALAFIAGTVTSVGPCVAPRFLGVAALAARERSVRARLWTVSAVVGGLFVAYAAIGMVASFALRIGVFSGYVYALLASVVAASGAWVVFRGDRGHSCTHDMHAPRSFGAPFLLGLSCGFVVSPCCTPIVAAMGTFASSAFGAPFAALLIAAFVGGHAAPLYAVAFGASWFERMVGTYIVRSATATVSGALLLFLGYYYAMLA